MSDPAGIPWPPAGPSRRSDIDLLAVVEGGVTDAEAEALERVVHQADNGGAAGIDLHVVTSEVARAPVRAPALELHIGRYDRSSAQCEVDRRTPACPDLLVGLSMARADGRAPSVPRRARWSVLDETAGPFRDR